MPEHVKAPWPDSTPEEDAAYALQAALWDMEFKQQIVEQGGPQVAEYVDPERAHLLPTGGRRYNVQGLYRPEAEEKSIMEIAEYAPLARELMVRGKTAPGPDTAAVVGGHSATPQIWAHEFGHRKAHKEGGSSSERWRLIHDAFRSDTPFEWADAVQRWRSWNRGWMNDSEEINSYKDVENHLKGVIEANSRYLINHEVEAREAKGDRPKAREGFFTIESLEKDQREEMEHRAKSWSIDKYNELVKEGGLDKATGGKVTMPSKTPKQAKFMRAVAHGWKPSRVKAPPVSVAKEFVEADKKYSGGFAENRYAKGGLAAMNEVDSNSERQRPLKQLRFQRGGRRLVGRRGRDGGGRRDGGYRVPTTTNVPPVTYAWGPEAGTTQELRDRMGYEGVMGYLGTVSGLRQAGWTPAPGHDPNDLASTMWYPPEPTYTGGSAQPGGPGGPLPGGSHIPLMPPEAYVGASSDVSGRESPYREQLREHQSKIKEILGTGSARGGPVRGYQEGGTARADNPFDPVAQKYQWRSWERKHGRDPDEPEVVAPPPAETAPPPPEDEGGFAAWLRSFFIPDPETENVEAVEEYMESIDQARGGRVNYQTGGLARVNRPRGGVPPWVEPVEQGYQFGGMATGFVPRGMGRFMPGGGGGRGGGFLSRLQQRAQAGQPRGGLAAAFQRRAGGLPPGIDPRAVAANPQGYARWAADPRSAGARGIQAGGWEDAQTLQNRYDREQARRREVGIDPLAYDRPTEGRYQPGEGDYMNRLPHQLPRRLPRKPMPGPSGPFVPPGGPVIGGGGGIPPWKQLPGQRRQVPPSPGRAYPGGPGGPLPGGEQLPMGGPRVPPNQQGWLQRMRMMNRPPSGPVGGGANRVGMRDQQGALSRAMQRGTGRAPMSRRFAYGRGAQQP